MMVTFCNTMPRQAWLRLLLIGVLHGLLLITREGFV